MASSLSWWAQEGASLPQLESSPCHLETMVPSRALDKPLNLSVPQFPPLGIEILGVDC